ncbi:hypothetical protein KUV28_21445 [Ferrimonas balearica]|nr:hypothetical protein [Ferrimonas balearica]
MTTTWEHRLVWQDHVIEIIHTCGYCRQIGLDHLSITCLSPERAALPFTGTGYKSQFLHESDVIMRGGAVAYVTEWLEEASQSSEWKAHVEASRQGSLF